MLGLAFRGVVGRGGFARGWSAVPIGRAGSMTRCVHRKPAPAWVASGGAAEAFRAACGC